MRVGATDKQLTHLCPHVYTENATDSERRTLLLEIDMMKDIGYHRHIVSMLACCTRGEELALVMEYVPFGNLQSFLRKQRSGVSISLSISSSVFRIH